MFPLPSLVILAAIIFVIGLVLGIAIGRQVVIHQSMGEAMVANLISSQISQPHVLLNNVTVPTPEATTQIDHVLITTTGIFVIETKHYQGWIFGGPDQPQWTQTIYKRKSRFKNPIRQNYGHFKTLQSLFKLPETNFIPIVVFTGDAEFKSDLGPTVLKLHQLIPFLTSARPTLFDERAMAYIVGRIEMKRLRRSIETDEYHLSAIRRKLASS
jgi:restriction system protein